MNFIKHRLCNDELQPAKGDEEHVSPLPVQRGKVKGTDVVETRSFWKPDAEELKILNAGGCVVMRCWSGTHPPVRIDAVPE